MRRILILLLFFLIPSGCAYLKTKKTPYDKGPRPDSLKAEAVIDVFGKDRLKGRAIIILKAPDKFRIEVAGAFLQTAMAIASNGSVIETYSNGETRAYFPVQGINPYPFTPQELVSALLLAEIPGKGNDYRITLDSMGFPVEMKKLNGQDVLFTIGYSDFRTVNGFYLPFSVVISYGYERVEIRYAAITTGHDEADSAFRLNIAGPAQ
ncbi:MAG: hypothetical protein AABZ23_05150 [Deltaproteobacteria bacterium]